MSFRLPTQTEKAEYVLSQFERIAAHYDLTNDAISLGMHRLWKKAAIDALNLKSDGIYLDVCCGTGDLALGVAQRLGPDGRVVGVDFSQNMLNLAARRAEKMRRVNPLQFDWVAADAEALPFSDDRFDGAIISFGLRNLTNLTKGLAEMTRVVKPGGKVINLDLGHPRQAIFTPLYNFYFQNIVPIIGDLLAGDRKAYTYLPTSLSTYPEPERISELFESVGLVNVVFQPLACGSVALHKGTVA